LRGQVRQVSPVPSQVDWWSSGMKVYPVQVALEESLEGPRPGMTADVRLTTGKSLDNVLVIPVQAIFGPTETGQRLCVVRTDGRLEQREIVAGESNGTRTEVRSGLKEGEDVVLNPRALYVEPTERRRP
jgi:HlyD family secretion protein